jgi:hypothetical protein
MPSTSCCISTTGTQSRLPRDWWDTWLDPNIEGDQDLVDAAVQAALPVAGRLEVYEVAPIPFRADGPYLIEPVAQLEGTGTGSWLSNPIGNFPITVVPSDS